mmetsp:Transcript_31092/g.63073  ORF Transcript_31092/g.63073 Transcript_31092/m.63073 type:complete len:209 (-) Transcript_31092:610-1236(-)
MQQWKQKWQWLVTERRRRMRWCRLLAAAVLTTAGPKALKTALPLIAPPFQLLSARLVALFRLLCLLCPLHRCRHSQRWLLCRIFRRSHRCRHRRGSGRISGGVGMPRRKLGGGPGCGKLRWTNTGKAGTPTPTTTTTTTTKHQTQGGETKLGLQRTRHRPLQQSSNETDRKRLPLPLLPLTPPLPPSWLPPSSSRVRLGRCRRLRVVL